MTLQAVGAAQDAALKAGSTSSSLRRRDTFWRMQQRIDDISRVRNRSLDSHTCDARSEAVRGRLDRLVALHGRRREDDGRRPVHRTRHGVGRGARLRLRSSVRTLPPWRLLFRSTSSC